MSENDEFGYLVGRLWNEPDGFDIEVDNTILPPRPDPVNNPPHYTSNPSGVECVEVAEHMTFCVGNAIKYLWRAGLKGDAVQDLEKAVWYIKREIARLEKIGQ